MIPSNDNIRTDWEAKFWDYHADNPRVYELIKSFTFKVIATGKKHFSIQGVIERVRWETSIETLGDDYKLNNNFGPYYARLFMDDFPEHAGFFRTRAMRYRRAA